MKRLLPHIHFGSVSGECVRDDAEGGRAGHYFEICWFGFQVGVALSSVYSERRRAERARKRYAGLD